MSVDLPLTVLPTSAPVQLSPADAATYAEWFASLADPTRVRLLHAVAVAGRAVPVGELAEQVGISQSTCSHHIRKLADVGFVALRKDKTATLVSVNAGCCTGLPHAADAVMGMLGPRPCCPEDLPTDVTVRALEHRDWAAVRRIYAEGIATDDATFETEVPDRRALDQTWLPDHRWVAEIDGQGRRLGGRQADLQPTRLQRGRRNRGLCRRWLPRPRGRESAPPPAGHRRRRNGPVDPADLDLPREPGQHRPAPVRRLPHPRCPRTHRPTPRHLARHRLPRTAPRRQQLTPGRIRSTGWSRPLGTQRVRTQRVSWRRWWSKCCVPKW